MAKQDTSSQPVEHTTDRLLGCCLGEGPQTPIRSPIARGATGSYADCRLCPRDCAVDRTAGKLGTCRSTDRVRVSHAVPHFGEEPPITGTRGSGTVFFVGCGLACAFCQNHQISHQGQAGREMPIEHLAELFLALQARGVHNVNLVTASHFTPSVVRALQLARRQGLSLPVVWNSSGYEKVETLRTLEGLVDVYLPDAKFADADLAERLSHARDYPEVNRAALAEMFRQVGHLTLDSRGLAARGMIVRHLVLPNHLDNTFAVLDHLADAFGPDLHLSLMAQFRPMGRTERLGDVDRPLTPDEAAVLPAWMERFGFHGWVQSLESIDLCIPDFERDAPFHWESIESEP